MKTLHLISILLLGLTINLFSQTVPTNGLVAWYPFNGNANDQSGNNLNGIVNGPTLTSDRFGNPSSAFYFDGVGDFMGIPHDSLLSFPSNKNYSLSIWINAEQNTFPNSMYDPILYKAGDSNIVHSGDNYPFYFLITRNNPNFPDLFNFYVHEDCHPSSQILSNTIDFNRWYNVTIVRDGNTYYMYLDGYLIGQDFYQSPTCPNYFNGPLYIGSDEGTSFQSNSFKGKLDDIAIYNRALTPCEINDINGFNLDSGLVAHYPFNSNALDVSGNNHHGTLQGAGFGFDRFNNANSAAQFDGINDFIDMGNIIDLSTQNAMSISAWFYPEQINGVPNRYTGISFGDKPTGELSLRVTQESLQSLQAILADGNNQSQLGNNTSSQGGIFAYNQWYHLAATYEDQNVRLYVNGQFVSANTGSNGNGGFLSAIPSNAALLIGKAFNTNFDQRFYHGRIDDVRVYNRKLNDCEIAELHQSGSVVPSVSLVQACIKDNISLSTNLDSAIWTDNFGNVIGSGTAVNFQFTNQPFVLATGINFCGCLQTDTFNFQLKAQPNYNLPDTFSVCPNVFDTLPFSFNTAGTISWSDGSLFLDSTILNPVIKPISNIGSNSIFQTIYAEMTNLSSGCSSLDSIVIEVTPKPHYYITDDTVFACHNVWDSTLIWDPLDSTQFFQIGVVYFGDTSFLPQGNIANIELFLGNNFDTIPRIEFQKILMEDMNGCFFSDSVLTLTYARFFAEAGADTFVCSGNSVPLGEVNNSAYTYLWTPTNFLTSVNSSNTTVSYPPSTTAWTQEYFIYKTDTITGCEESDSVQVDINRELNVFAGIDTSICSQDIIGLGQTSINGFTYLWLGSDSISNLTISNPDFTYLNPDTIPVNFELTITATEDSTQCNTSDTVNVSIKPQIYVDAGADLNPCGSDSIVIGKNNNRPYSFTWLPSNGILNPNTDSSFFSLDNFSDSLQSFEYYLTAAFDGCIESDSILIDLRPKPFDDVMGPRVVCPGVDSAAYFVGRPFTDYSYTWLLDGGIISSNFNDSILVSWDSTNLNAYVGIVPHNTFACVGDTFIWNVRINPLLIPEIEIDSAKLCEREKDDQVYKIRYPIVNSSYFWSVNGGVIISGQGSDEIQVEWNAPGIGQVWVNEENITNLDSCFGISDTMEIEILTDPVLDSIYGPDDLCNYGDSIWYYSNSSQPGTFSWTSDSISQLVGANGMDSILISTFNDGDFTINTFIQNAQGCFSDTLEKTVNIRYLQFPEIQSDTNQICFWDSTEIIFRIKDRYDSSDYQWTLNSGQIVSGQGQNEIRIRIFQPDTLRLFVEELNTSTMDTCFGISDTFEVYLYPRPQRALSILGEDSICDNPDCEWYTYPGWLNSTFYWNTDANVCNTLLGNDSLEIAFPQIGKYTLEVVELSEYDCIGDTVFQSIEIFPNPETRIVFNDSIICPTDQNGRLYRVEGLDFSTYNWQITGGVIIEGQGSEEVRIDWEDTVGLNLEVLEITFAECTNESVNFPLYIDNMKSELYELGYDSSFSKFIVNGESVLSDFNDQNEIILLAGESRPSFLSSKAIEPGIDQFILDSIFGTQVIYYQLASINACNDTVASEIHNNIVLTAEANEELNLFSFDWNAYEAWRGNLTYNLIERNADGSLELIDNTQSENFSFENPEKLFRHCYFVEAKHNENEQVKSRSNLICLEFKRALGLPNVVTANGDGYNDKFIIENISLYPEHKLIIFNRDGRRVFESNTYQNTWPPEDLRSGVYFFKLIIEGGKEQEFGGYVHLMR